jgi:multimeric flavodoxin WrbA
MKKRPLKDPDKTNFNPLHGDRKPAEFKKFFEANYFGDWKKYYKELGGKVPAGKSEGETAR